MEFAIDRSGRATFRGGIARNDRARRLYRPLLQQSAASRQAAPDLLGANPQLSCLWRKRFCGPFSIGNCSRTDSAGDFYLGHAIARKGAWLVGGDYLHAFAANI